MKAFTTDGGDTFYASCLDGATIAVYASQSSAMPIATMDASHTTASLSTEDCDYYLTRLNGTSFTVRSVGKADKTDSCDIAATGRKQCSVGGREFYAISEGGTINFYITETGGTPVASVSASQTADTFTSADKTFNFGYASATSATISTAYTESVTLSTPNKNTNYTFTVDDNTYYIYRDSGNGNNSTQAIRRTSGGTVIATLSKNNLTYTDSITGVAFTRVSADSITAAYSATVNVSATSIPAQTKTTFEIGTGDTVYLLTTDDSMNIYTSQNGEPVKTVAAGATDTLTIGDNTYRIKNENNARLVVVYQTDIDETSTVSNLPGKKACTFNSKTFYISSRGADGGKVINVYDSATAVRPVITTNSYMFEYDSEDYTIRRNSDSSVTLGLIAEQTEGDHFKNFTVYVPNYYWNGSGSGHKIVVNSAMTNTAGETVDHTGYLNTSGTYTQIGLRGAKEMFCDVTDTANRVPVIVLVSDGSPQQYDTHFENPSYTYEVGASGADCAYYTVRTAMCVKQQVDAHYPENTAQFFSLGPGVTDLLGKTVLYPSGSDKDVEGTYLERCENDTSSSCRGLYTKLMEAKENDPNVSLEFINFADWGLVGDLKADELESGFQHVVQLVNDIPRPITEAEIDYTETHTHMADGKNMVFVDTIGSGMGLSFINDDGSYTLSKAPVLMYCDDTGEGYTAKSCDKKAIDGGYVYTLKYNYTITESSTNIPKDLSTIEVNVYAYTNGGQMVEWKIPADLVPAINFDTDDNEYKDTDPVRLIYKVHLTTEKTGTYYTNSVSDPATCVFVPAIGNSHYYDTELDAQDNIVSDFIYTGEDDCKDKTANTTGTKTFAWDYETDEVSDYGVIIQTLGNNGKISIASKEVAPDTVVIDYGIPVKVNVKSNDGLTGSITAISKTIATGTVLNTTAYTTSRFGTDKVGKNADLELEYGTAVLDNDGCVTYTLDAMEMSAAETLYYEFTTTGGQIFYSTLTIIPATTIYYEDSFVTFTGEDWETEGTLVTGALQHEDRAGADDANVYGYDGAYKTMETYSLGQSHKITVSADSPNKSGTQYASFTFTGTAFDVISVTSGDTGTVNCIVTDSDDEVVGDWVVDTYYGYDFNEDQYYMNVWQLADGSWHRILQESIEEADMVNFGETIDLPLGDNGADLSVEVKKKLPAVSDTDDGEMFVLYSKGWEASDRGTLYQIPVIKSPTLDYGTYTVNIIPIYSRYFDNAGDGDYDFYLDAVRIYNPADPDETGNEAIAAAYSADREKAPKYLELKNVVTAATYSDESTTGVLFLDGYTDTDLSDGVGTYSNFGPNNEVYLAKGNSIAFQINDANHDNIASVQIAARIFEDSDNSGKTTTNAETYSLSNNTKTKFSINGIDFWAQRKGTAAPYSFDIYVTSTATDPLTSVSNASKTSTKDLSGASITFTYVSETKFSATYSSKTNFTVVAVDTPVTTIADGETKTATVGGYSLSFKYESDTMFSVTLPGVDSKDFTKNTTGRTAYKFNGVTFYAERTGNSTAGYSFRIYTNDVSKTVLPAKSEAYSTATDLYYDITQTFKSSAFNGNTSPVIVIANTGEGKISITNIKITYNESLSVAEEEPSLTALSPEAFEDAVSFANNIYMAGIVADDVPADQAVPTAETGDGNEKEGNVISFIRNLFRSIVNWFIKVFNYIRFKMSVIY